ncbi:GntR family transcriptional regulator [Amycolatopsis acididurans]|nr:GntR family transcriptional regulator [Amycolatopsis acididurans]
MSALDPDDARPSYRQLADRLAAAIESGDRAPGEQLPTHRELASEYGVAIETAKRALSELRAAGLIVTRQGKGSYVRHRADERPERRPADQDMAETVSDLRREIESIKERLAALEAGD